MVCPRTFKRASIQKIIFGRILMASRLESRSHKNVSNAFWSDRTHQGSFVFERSTAEILHVAGSDLKDIGAGLHPIKGFFIHHFGNSRHAGTALVLDSIFKPA